MLVAVNVVKVVIVQVWRLASSSSFHFGSCSGGGGAVRLGRELDGVLGAIAQHERHVHRDVGTGATGTRELIERIVLERERTSVLDLATLALRHDALEIQAHKDADGVRGARAASRRALVVVVVENHLPIVLNLIDRARDRQQHGAGRQQHAIRRVDGVANVSPRQLQHEEPVLLLLLRGPACVALIVVLERLWRNERHLREDDTHTGALARKHTPRSTSRPRPRLEVRTALVATT